MVVVDNAKVLTDAEYIEDLSSLMSLEPAPKVVTQIRVPDALLRGWWKYWESRGYTASPELQARLDALPAEIG